MQALTLLLSDLWQIHNLFLFQSHVPASSHRSILCLSWPKLEGGCHEKPAINSQTNSGSLCTTYHLCVLYNALQDTVHAEWVEICQGLVNSEGKKKGGIVEKRKKARKMQVQPGAPKKNLTSYMISILVQRFYFSLKWGKPPPPPPHDCEGFRQLNWMIFRPRSWFNQ